jgi:ferredoxin
MKLPKLIHKRKNCIGCNSCVTISPNNWKMNEQDGKAHLKNSKEKNGIHTSEIPFEDVEKNKNAAKACPMKIIRVEEN